MQQNINLIKSCYKINNINYMLYCHGFEIYKKNGDNFTIDKWSEPIKLLDNETIILKKNSYGFFMGNNLENINNLFIYGANNNNNNILDKLIKNPKIGSYNIKEDNDDILGYFDNEVPNLILNFDSNNTNINFSNDIYTSYNFGLFKLPLQFEKKNNNFLIKYYDNYLFKNIQNNNKLKRKFGIKSEALISLKKLETMSTLKFNGKNLNNFNIDNILKLKQLFDPTKTKQHIIEQLYESGKDIIINKNFNNKYLSLLDILTHIRENNTENKKVILICLVCRQPVTLKINENNIAEFTNIVELGSDIPNKFMENIDDNKITTYVKNKFKNNIVGKNLSEFYY
mgnify:CR=1 FL=1|tara:strand:- start:852 stop:1874 length:1023 start_codon:yes stop_codon:yes gene_type:complete